MPHIPSLTSHPVALLTSRRSPHILARIVCAAQTLSKLIMHSSQREIMRSEERARELRNVLEPIFDAMEAAHRQPE